MSSDLSSRQGAIEASDLDVISDEPEICFQIPESGRLYLDLPRHRSSALEYLKYRVAGNPSDLLSHLRRIILLDGIGDEENLFAALLDLFIALDSKGESLRSRLLAQYRPKLSDSHYEVLRKGLANGAAIGSESLGGSSVLAKGITGTCSLIRPLEAGAAESAPADPLREARDFLEYSQIDEAREVLEQAVLDDPACAEFQTELLELYRAGRDLKNLEKVRDALLGSGVSLSEDWSTAFDYISENV